MTRNFIENRRRGLFAKRAGDHFETWLKHECARQKWAVTQIPSGCEWVGHGKAKPVKTPFDFVFASHHGVIFGDAKSTLSLRWTYSQNEPHQVSWLKFLEDHGQIAGYIVNFRELNQTIFFSATKLSGLRPRCSLAPEDGIIIGNNDAIDLTMITRWVAHVRLSEKEGSIGTTKS